jgi:hypothetical protein
MPIFWLANGGYSCDGFFAPTLEELARDLQSFGWRRSNRFALKRGDDVVREFALGDILDDEAARRREAAENY